MLWIWPSSFSGNDHAIIKIHVTLNSPWSRCDRPGWTMERKHVIEGGGLRKSKNLHVVAVTLLLFTIFYPPSYVGVKYLLYYGRCFLWEMSRVLLSLWIQWGMAGFQPLHNRLVSHKLKYVWNVNDHRLTAVAEHPSIRVPFGGLKMYRNLEHWSPQVLKLYQIFIYKNRNDS